ncbi:MAG TPA: GNAT family N-acetyltransferase [Actinomycetes bacterium]|nr:GNAT family N-acetyltransferase [Actinomycetes bacterium]
MAAAAHLVPPERPGPMIAQHVLATGHGGCLADRWPEPRALLVETGGNWTLAGDPAALDPAAVRGRVTGFVDAPVVFEPLLRATARELHEWPRVILTLDGPDGPPPGHRRHFQVRRLGPGDGGPLAELGDETGWIASTWGGPGGLAASGVGWGAFEGRRLAAVACPFFVGNGYEDLGVATEPEFRGLGLSTACAATVCQDVRRRGRVPSWTTSPDNTASLRVAAKLGFRLQRHDRLLVVDIPPPEPAAPPQP